MNAAKLLFSSTPIAILLGAVLISGSILVSGGVIKLKNKNSALGAASPVPAVSGQVAPTPAPKVDVELGHFPVQGEKTAKIAIVEFADFRCPFCEQYTTQTEPQIIKDYVDTGKAKYSFRHYQFLGSASVVAGNASECANEQGKFWEFHKWLYDNQPPENDTSMYNSEKLTTAAESVGLNGGQFKSCLDSTKFAKNVTDDETAASAVGVTGTPSFIIGKLDDSGTKIIQGTLLVGAQPYGSFKTILDSLQ